MHKKRGEEDRLRQAVAGFYQAVKRNDSEAVDGFIKLWKAADAELKERCLPEEIANDIEQKISGWKEDHSARPIQKTSEDRSRKVGRSV